MYIDDNGREFNKKPIELGTLVKVHKGYFDTFNDEEVGIDQLAIIVNVERFMEDNNKGSYNLMPLYDIVYIDESGKCLGTEYCIRYHNVYRSGLKLNSAKYKNLKCAMDKLIKKLHLTKE